MGKKLGAAEEARYAPMADWAESDAGLIPEDAGATGGEGPDLGRAYLDNLLGSSEAVNEDEDAGDLDG